MGQSAKEPMAALQTQGHPRALQALAQVGARALRSKPFHPVYSLTGSLHSQGLAQLTPTPKKEDGGAARRLGRAQVVTGALLRAHTSPRLSSCTC